MILSFPVSLNIRIEFQDREFHESPEVHEQTTPPFLEKHGYNFKMPAWWFRTAKNRDVSTGPLAGTFARTAHSFASEGFDDKNDLVLSHSRLARIKSFKTMSKHEFDCFIIQGQTSHLHQDRLSRSHVFDFTFLRLLFVRLYLCSSVRPFVPLSFRPSVRSFLRAEGRG